mmetsp:Transcript_38970/g.90656  ORF Transcript_38970/g.90656 Transcript_38970/m.90656 type:complete len:103 (+) Transcript_38970:306-614(+)
MLVVFRWRMRRKKTEDRWNLTGRTTTDRKGTYSTHFAATSGAESTSPTEMGPTRPDGDAPSIPSMSWGEGGRPAKRRVMDATTPQKKTIGGDDSDEKHRAPG